MKDKLKLIESNKLMNGRLAISLLSIFVALFALLYDWYDLHFFYFYIPYSFLNFDIPKKRRYWFTTTRFST